MTARKHDVLVPGLAVPAVTRHRSLAGCLVRVLAFAALTTLAAQFCVPIGRVPITLQTVAVLVTGFVLRPREAAAAMALYLGAGAVGAPVFALGRCGIWGPTAGYLLGFLPAAVVVSLVCYGRLERMGRLMLGALAGTVIVFACGVAWLSVYPGGLAAALDDGLLRFGGLALVKAGLAVATVRTGGLIIDRRRGSATRER